MNPEDFKVSSRVSVEGYRGTIRWVGQVKQGNSGESASGPYWLGIEWDDPSRGKHSGEVKGIQYFTVKVPNSASLIKIGSKAINTGRDFVLALKEKYLEKDDQIQDKEISLGGNSKIPVETVGWEKLYKKQKQLHSLKEVGLLDMNISCVTISGSVQNTCPAIEDLDLSRNLFSSIFEVAEICVELPNLFSLRLNSNRFENFETLPSHLTTAFRQIKTLSLNRTLLNLESIVLLEPYLEQLEELHLGYNEIVQLNTVSLLRKFSKLKLLNLEGNKITQWQEFREISQLPCLENILLNDNKIESILPLAPAEFVSLKTINLNRNNISDWQSVHYLNSLPKLVEIRFKDNPVLAPISEVTIRHSVLVGRLAKATIVNGSAITKAFRQDSEIYYANECLRQKASMDEMQFKKTHPRFDELMAKYELSSYVAPEHKTIKEDLLSLKFIFGEQSIEKKVPEKIRVRALKSLISRLFRDSPRTFELKALFKDGRSIGIEDDLRDLHFYSVESGDAIIIE